MQFAENILISLKNISLKRKNKDILQSVSLDIKSGEIITIIGPNGSGKTSLAKIIAGIIEDYQGQIYKQNNINIGYMPQNIYIDQILPMTSKYFLKLCKKDTRNFDEIVSLTSIETLLHKQVYNLSGGEMQKILLARALLGKPDLLLLDEPTKAMDVNASSNFYQIIDKVRQEKKIASLIISHDLYMVMKSTDHVFCLNKHICCHGRPQDVANDPSYISLFGNASNSLGIYMHHHDHEHL